MTYQFELIVSILVGAIAYVAYRGGHTLGYMNRMIDEKKEMRDFMKQQMEELKGEIHAHDQYSDWADCKICNPFYGKQEGEDK